MRFHLQGSHLVTVSMNYIFYASKILTSSFIDERHGSIKRLCLRRRSQYALQCLDLYLRSSMRSNSVTYQTICLLSKQCQGIETSELCHTSSFNVLL